ncbi:MAG: ATP-binding protein [Bacteroidota bacterium]
MTPPPSPPRHPVARRLLIRLAALGVVLAVLTAGLQLYLEYQRDLAAVTTRLDEIEKSYLPSVRETAWLYDNERLQILVEGIDNLPGIAQARVVTPEGQVLAQSGTPATEPLTRSFDLIHDYSGQRVVLGQLVVSAGLETLRATATERMGVTLAANMVLLAAIATLLYWQVHALVSGRLGAIAAYARRLGHDGPAAAPLADSAGAIGGAEDEFTDLAVTLSRMHRDLAAAYEALSASEARFRELFTSSPVPLFEEDFSAVKALLDEIPAEAGADWLEDNDYFVRRCAGAVRVLDVNNAAVNLHRAADRQELLTRLSAIFVPSSYDAFRRQLECLRAGIWDLTVEAQVRTLDGQALDIVLHWHVPPQHRHSLTRVIIASEDVSALKQARRSSEMTLERLMETNSELERFTFVASHDLQEPVRAVVSFTQLLQRRLQAEGSLTPESTEFLDYLLAAAERMQAQLAGLQDYARAGQGSTLGAVKLGDALADARGQLEAALTAVGAEIDAPHLPMVVGDRAQLALLFRHLLDNAIKFRRTGQKLRISVTCRPHGANWRVTVRDNGIGIEAEYAATVFELFRRLHGPGQLPGAGIGLTICRRIVERHGGVIGIDTAVTDGTAVVFTLPAGELTSLTGGA